MDKEMIRQRVLENFAAGHHCAEVVVKTALELFSDNGHHPEVMKAAGAFGGGIAGSTEELCGAFTTNIA